MCGIPDEIYMACLEAYSEIISKQDATGTFYSPAVLALKEGQFSQSSVASLASPTLTRGMKLFSL